MDQGFEDLKARIEDLERNPRTVVTTPDPNNTTTVAPEVNKNNVVYNNVEKIIDDAVKYITKEKEIDEIIGRFIEDLRINKTINK